MVAGGCHSTVLTHAFSLKELCEFKLVDSVTLSNARRLKRLPWFKSISDYGRILCDMTNDILHMISVIIDVF